MRKTWVAVHWVGVTLLALAGCYSPGANRIKAPPHEEQYQLPPDDKRFSAPPQYPKDTLNKDDLHKNQDDTKGLPKNMRGGMGGMGGG